MKMHELSNVMIEEDLGSFSKYKSTPSILQKRPSNFDRFAFSWFNHLWAGAIYNINRSKLGPQPCQVIDDKKEYIDEENKIVRIKVNDALTLFRGRSHNFSSIYYEGINSYYLPGPFINMDKFAYKFKKLNIKRLTEIGYLR